MNTWYNILNSKNTSFRTLAYQEVSLLNSVGLLLRKCIDPIALQGVNPAKKLKEQQLKELVEFCFLNLHYMGSSFPYHKLFETAWISMQFLFCGIVEKAVV